MKLDATVDVVPGSEALPFIAEYCSFVFLHTSCGSDGDAASRYDREWSWLHHSDRTGDAEFEVLCPQASGRTDGVIVVRATAMIVARYAAYLTALRTGGRLLEGGIDLPLAEVATTIPDLAQRRLLADRWREKFLGRAI